MKRFSSTQAMAGILVATAACMGFAAILLAFGCNNDSASTATTGQTTPTAVHTATTPTTSTTATTQTTAAEDTSGASQQGASTQAAPQATPLAVVAQGATPYDSTEMAAEVPQGSQIVLYADISGDATGVWISMSCYGVDDWNINLSKKTTTAGVTHWSAYWTVPSSHCSCRYRASATDGSSTVDYWEGGLSASSYPLEVM